MHGNVVSLDLNFFQKWRKVLFPRGSSPSAATMNFNAERGLALPTCTGAMAMSSVPTAAMKLIAV